MAAALASIGSPSAARGHARDMDTGIGQCAIACGAHRRGSRRVQDDTSRGREPARRGGKPRRGHGVIGSEPNRFLSLRTWRSARVEPRLFGSEVPDDRNDGDGSSRYRLRLVSTLCAAHRCDSASRSRFSGASSRGTPWIDASRRGNACCLRAQKGYLGLLCVAARGLARCQRRGVAGALFSRPADQRDECDRDRSFRASCKQRRLFHAGSPGGSGGGIRPDRRSAWLGRDHGACARHRTPAARRHRFLSGTRRLADGRASWRRLGRQRSKFSQIA